ncbi:MAG: hypothetical protein ACOX8I_00305 [Bacillota bacterium]|jgi:hypothetical protein
MKKLAVFVLVVMLFTLFVNTALAARQVSVQAPNEYVDAIAKAISKKGAEVTQSIGRAGTVVKVNVVEIKTRSNFNWWFLLCGLWPIVPITRTTADATVDVTVMEGSRTIYNQQASESVKGQFFFGDIYHISDDRVDELKAEAIEEAVLKALRNYSF